MLSFFSKLLLLYLKKFTHILFWIMRRKSISSFLNRYYCTWYMVHDTWYMISWKPTNPIPISYLSSLLSSACMILPYVYLSSNWRRREDDERTSHQSGRFLSLLSAVPQRRSRAPQYRRLLQRQLARRGKTYIYIYIRYISIL